MVSQRRHICSAVGNDGEPIIEGMKAAKKAGAVVSFDLNFREKLWNIWGGQKKAEEVVARIVRKHRCSRRK